MGSITKYGIIGLFALLVGVGGTVLFLQQGELSKAYVCSTTGEVGIYERLSGTNRTAYPMPVGNGARTMMYYNACWNGERYVVLDKGPELLACYPYNCEDLN